MGKRIILFLLFVSQWLPFSCAAHIGVEITDFWNNPQGDSVINKNSEYIAILGDCQYHFCLPGLDTIYGYYMDWVKTQAESYGNIKALIHTGDIAETNSISQYETFKSLTGELATKVPYFSAIGDHDYTWEGKDYVINDRYSTHFNEYVQFPLSVSHVVTTYEDGRMENCIVKLPIQDNSLFLIFLEFGPRKEVVEWANDYVSTHTNDKFVVVNHEYLESGGSRRTKNLKCINRLRNTTYVTPDELWTALIRCNDNIVCVLCGHVDSLFAITPEVNEVGNEVNQVEFNIQSERYRPMNWIMLWEFPSESDSANVLIYNVKNHQFINKRPYLARFRYR